MQRAVMTASAAAQAAHGMFQILERGRKVGRGGPSFPREHQKILHCHRT